MTRLSSNADLLDYLARLEVALGVAGYTEEASDIRVASRASAGMSTEFLGESLIALRKVSPAVRNGLSEIQAEDLDRVMKQIEFSLKR